MSEFELMSELSESAAKGALSEQAEDGHRTYSPGPEEEENPDAAGREGAAKDGLDAHAEEASPAPSPAGESDEKASKSEHESEAKEGSGGRAEEASPAPSPAGESDEKASKSEHESEAKEGSDGRAGEASPAPSPAGESDEKASKSEHESEAKEGSDGRAEEASPAPSPAGESDEKASKSERESEAKEGSDGRAEEASPAPSPAGESDEKASKSERESGTADGSSGRPEEVSHAFSPNRELEDKANKSGGESVTKGSDGRPEDISHPFSPNRELEEKANKSEGESVTKDGSDGHAEETSPVQSPEGEVGERSARAGSDHEEQKGESCFDDRDTGNDQAVDRNAHDAAPHLDDKHTNGAAADATDAPRHTQEVNDLFKPRMTPYKQPDRWDPIETYLGEDVSDELEITTARKPVFTDEEKADVPTFKNGEPDYEGEYLSCFDEPNLLYRIYNREEKTWAFYNDTYSYEMHVRFTFAKLSKLQALGNTKMYTQETGEHIAEVIVYPRETEMFVKGNANGFTSKLRAVPLTEEYYARRQELANNKIQEEIARVKSIVGDVTDSEQVLKACVENGIPFVDLEFPPCQDSLATGAKKPFKRLPWVRPSQCLPDYMADQVRLFRGPIRPGQVDQGELGDSWVMCSIAVLTERPDKVVNMFRHPTDPELGKKERSVGGYRVSLNKNGQWRSVIVDDYLPMSGGRLKYAKSRYDLAEIWPCILEKAFAKLHNSYANICSGDPLHALQDMTGFPTSRFDDAFANAPLSGKDDLFQDWVRYVKAQYQIILSTPGKNPRDKASGECHTARRYTSVGLLTGHAYVVLDAAFFPEYQLRLVKLRNAWGRGSEWNGDWSDGDEKWERYPDVAVKCGYSNGESDGTFWMAWDACLRYFNGGGVCFTRNSINDYRVPSTFVNCTPSCVLEITVEQPTWMCFMLSQKDKRGSPEAREYNPVMISIAQPIGGGLYRVVQNSSADAYHPLSDKWTFYQARDISILYELLPESSPYIVIPRLMLVESQPDEVPYTLSFSCKRAVGHEGVTVQLKTIDKDNKVLYNFPKFEPDLSSTDVEYQARVAHKPFPELKVDSSVC
ncbi:calpain-like cysteine peptidase, putative [Trypanosoma brucei gambiense DAL972]|uniref:Calpain-like cysteine peptidase, putative n=1 Tax=Trypanosoma brucei gambiense (strain MHOM/CI/86/DAL972) TaxID=679716 RepID=C9ZIE7_TRYB9|nr:calpain-like cysteine peptidase, putative [Trypanosoma brucei gambiense DAL972]CBH08939.1 calpain-like cysteine peptidase, putative [Trypanosoma brucei gambiense DAL972]|eukprot:XP_011771380.1 calpain-like cysteine peptidase, putative [Trypanosoma brucei gambiense DAL972]